MPATTFREKVNHQDGGMLERLDLVVTVSVEHAGLNACKHAAAQPGIGRHTPVCVFNR